MSAVDYLTVLHFFDTFHANHKRTCGAERLDVAADQESGAVAVKLSCPICSNTVRGTIRNEDWPHVCAVLNPKKQN